jgi:hypothetical protein
MSHLRGTPVNFSFFVIMLDPLISVTTPVAEILKEALSFPSVLKAQKPVFGAEIGPQNVASQCICSGVYLSIRFLVPSSSE